MWDSPLSRPNCQPQPIPDQALNSGRVPHISLLRCGPPPSEPWSQPGVANYDLECAGASFAERNNPKRGRIEETHGSKSKTLRPVQVTQKRTCFPFSSKGKADVGNRLKQNAGSNQTPTEWAYYQAAGNQMTSNNFSPGANSLVNDYDADGRLTNDGSKQYVWQADGHLCEVETAANT